VLSGADLVIRPACVSEAQESKTPIDRQSQHAVGLLVVKDETLTVLMCLFSASQLEKRQARTPWLHSISNFTRTSEKENEVQRCAFRNRNNSDILMAWRLCAGRGGGIRGRATELGMVAYYYIKVIDKKLG
jgi:hypothetical protein